MKDFGADVRNTGTIGRENESIKPFIDTKQKH